MGGHDRDWNRALALCFRIVPPGRWMRRYGLEGRGVLASTATARRHKIMHLHMSDRFYAKAPEGRAVCGSAARTDLRGGAARKGGPYRDNRF